MRARIAAVLLAVTAAIVGCRGERPRVALNPNDGTITLTGSTKPFAVHSGAVTEPAMLGTYSVQGNSVVFHPRFPLVPGLPYTVRYDGMETVVMLPKQSTAATVVQQVYPTADELPANQLKFYLDFSAPMSFGDAYRHIRLLDDAGREIPRAFLQTAHELWDARRQRFTLILDPGRIKRGLRFNEQVGAPLREGGRYRLVIDADWRDGDGNPLRAPFEKPFRVVLADRTAPLPHAWRLNAPTTDTTEPLRLALNEPLDRALLEEMLVVLDEHGQLVEGRIEVAGAETQWLFHPSQPWRRGRYVVHVSTKIEDRAGNNLVRLFDEDVSHPATANSASSIELAFVTR